MSVRVDIAARIGSAVPSLFREAGKLACWVVLIEGQDHSGPFDSRAEAEASLQAWREALNPASSAEAFMSAACAAAR